MQLKTLICTDLGNGERKSETDENLESYALSVMIAQDLRFLTIPD